MTGVAQRTAELEDNVNFYAWAAERWPAERFTVQLDPLEIAQEGEQNCRAKRAGAAMGPGSGRKSRPRAPVIGSGVGAQDFRERLRARRHQPPRRLAGPPPRTISEGGHSSVRSCWSSGETGPRVIRQGREPAAPRAGVGGGRRTRASGRPDPADCSSSIQAEGKADGLVSRQLHHSAVGPNRHPRSVAADEAHAHQLRRSGIVTRPSATPPTPSETGTLVSARRRRGRWQCGGLGRPRCLFWSSTMTN